MTINGGGNGQGYESDESEKGGKGMEVHLVVESVDSLERMKRR